MKVGVGITGASGVDVAKKLVEALEKQEVEVFTIVSQGAKLVCKEEGTDCPKSTYEDKDLAAPVSSSSNKWDAFVIVPASVKTISAVANAYTDNLIARVADNTLKMGRTLVVCPRETPLSLPQVKNLERLLLAGALIMPLNVAYYPKPKTIDDVTDYFVGKIMDLLGIENNMYKRWKG